MVEVWLPYGRSEVPVRVPEERLLDLLKPNKATQLLDPMVEATKLLKSNDSFLQKAQSASHVCIVLGSCGTEQMTIDLTKAILQLVSNPDSSTILCTEESAEPDSTSVGSGRVLRHTSKSETLACTTLKNGFGPQINSEFVKADLRVLVGELRPHQFLGYAGLCDIVFPYLGSEASIVAHGEDKTALTLESLHRERIEIAESFDNLFALGIVLDSELRPAAITFDRMETTLASLEPIVSNACSQQATKRTDILVMSSGGAPFDTTLDRAVETFPAGLNVLKREGALIVAAECSQGYGGRKFYEWSNEHKEPRYLESRLRHHFSYDGFKASFLGRALQTHRVYLVSTIPDHYVEHVFGLKAAPTVNAALQSAQRVHGSESTISVIPNASRVAPTLLEAEKH